MKSSDASADQNSDRHYQGYATGSKRISSIVPVWVEGTVGEAVDNLSGRMANRTGTIRRKAGLRDPTRHSKCSVPGYCAKQNKSYRNARILALGKELLAHGLSAEGQLRRSKMESIVSARAFSPSALVRTASTPTALIRAGR